MCPEEDDIKDCAEYYPIGSIGRFLNQMNRCETFMVERLGDIGTKPWNPYFGKCTAVIRFRSNLPISIVSYGFFGPLETNCYGKYHMEIELLTADYRTIAKSEVVTSVQKGSEIFHVKFDSAVPILPCTWYNAKFSLLGPPTGQSEKICSIKRIKCGDEIVTFRFEEPDSNQLPEIAFKLRF